MWGDSRGVQGTTMAKLISMEAHTAGCPQRQRQLISYAGMDLLEKGGRSGGLGVAKGVFYCK